MSFSLFEMVFDKNCFLFSIYSMSDRKHWIDFIRIEWGKDLGWDITLFIFLKWQSKKKLTSDSF